MRVIAGQFKGRKLAAVRSSATRPTSDRVREALFSVLGEIKGARALDLFAGSGALGIEALSRGAESVTFVEKDVRALKTIRANLGLVLDASAQVVQAKIEQMSVSDFLRDAPAGQQFDLAFIDPPYDLAGELTPVLNDLLPRVLGPGATVVTESDRRQPLALDVAPSTQKRYGDTILEFHRLPG